MAQGNYDHPAYLARMVMNMGVNTAGTTNQSQQCVMPWPIKIHTINAVVVTAGTATAAQMMVMAGTATAGSVTVGTGTAGSVVQSTADVAYTVPAGTVIGLLAKSDATAVDHVTVEYSIPPTATWLGGE